MLDISRADFIELDAMLKSAQVCAQAWRTHVRRLHRNELERNGCDSECSGRRDGEAVATASWRSGCHRLSKKR